MNKQPTPQQLPAGSYKEYLIPKKGKGFRAITAPDAALLKYQRANLLKLEQYFLSQVRGTPLSNTVHGFLSNHNCVTAAKRHIGYDTTIMMDISSFFDNVLLNMVPPQFRDPSFFHQKGYAAQGFATSPMLANIAILPALRQINELLDDLFEDYVFSLYADDLQISINEDDYEETADVIEGVTAIIENAGFRINAKKTRIKYAKYGWRRILGVNVGSDSIRATRKTMRKIRAAKHQSNHSSLGGLVTWSRCYSPKKYRVSK